MARLTMADVAKYLQPEPPVDPVDPDGESRENRYLEAFPAAPPSDPDGENRLNRYLEVPRSSQQSALLDGLSPLLRRLLAVLESRP